VPPTNAKAATGETRNAGRSLRKLACNESMPVQHFVDEQGRYDGKTLQEL